MAIAKEGETIQVHSYKHDGKYPSGLAGNNSIERNA